MAWSRGPCRSGVLESRVITLNLAAGRLHMEGKPHNLVLVFIHFLLAFIKPHTRVVLWKMKG